MADFQQSLANHTQIILLLLSAVCLPNSKMPLTFKVLLQQMVLVNGAFIYERNADCGGKAAARHRFLLASKADGERVWRRDQQADGGNQHVQTSGSCHQPLAALRVILQDALIAFKNSFLWCRTGWTVRRST